MKRPSPILSLYTSVLTAATGIGVLTLAVPLFSTGSLHASYTELGLIAISSSIAYVVATPVAGKLSDRFNRAKLFVVSTLLNGLASLLLVVARSIPDVVLIRAATGFVYGFFFISIETLAYDLVPFSKLVSTVGGYSTAWTLGIMIGPALGGYLLEVLGFREVFLIGASIIAMGSLVAAVLILPQGPRRRSIKADESKGLGVAIIKKTLPIVPLVALSSIFFGIMGYIFPGYADAIGVGSFDVGMLLAIFGAVRIGAFALSEPIFRFGIVRSLTLSLIAMASSLIGIGLSTQVLNLAVFVALGSISVGILWPQTMNLFYRLFTPGKVGAAMGWYETVFGIGVGTGAVLAGFIADVYSPTVPFLLLGLGGIVMIGYVLRSRKAISTIAAPPAS